MNQRRALSLILLACAFLTAQEADPLQRVKPIVDAWAQRDRSGGGTAEGRRQLESEMLTWLSEHETEPWAYQAVALGLNQINRNPQAIGVLQRYLRQFLTNRALAPQVWFFFGNWGNADDLKLVPVGWRDERGYWQTAYYVAARSRDGKAHAEAYRALLARTPPAADAFGRERHGWAEDLLRAAQWAEAEHAARQALAIAEVAPPPVPGTLMYFHRSTLAWALFQSGRQSDAFREMERAIQSAEKARDQDRDQYLRYALILERAGRKAEALAALEKELAWGSATATTAATREWTRLAGEALPGEALARINELALSRLDLDKNGFREFDEPLTVTDLKDFEGQPLDLAQYRGRPLVIEFWATWCTPCLAAMKQTHALQSEAPLGVVGVTLDDLERTELVKRFVADKGYQVTLARGGAQLQARYGRAVPGRFLIDAQGRLRAVEQGFTGTTAAAFAAKVRSLRH